MFCNFLHCILHPGTRVPCLLDTARKLDHALVAQAVVPQKEQPKTPSLKRSSLKLYPYGILNGYSFGFIRVLLFVESSDQPPCLCSLFIFTFHTRPGPQVQMFQLSQTLKNTRLGDSRTGTWKRRQFRQFRQSAGGHRPRQFRIRMSMDVKTSTKIILYIYIICVYIYKNHTSFLFLLKFP